MMVVIADDFSGAAEMAGIAHRYGLAVSVQHSQQYRDDRDLVVIDSNTRSMEKLAALQKMHSIAEGLKAWRKPLRIYKKVDSVMRGYIAAEATVLQQELGFERILLLPANPGRNRKIISGHYFVNDTPLDQTVFATDPEFPAKHSLIEKLLDVEASVLPHQHISQGYTLPSGSFITGDVSEAEDFKKYLNSANEKDLCCGAAEFFESWLQHHGYNGKKKKIKVKRQHPLVLIINGSTVKIASEKDELERLNIPRFSIPGSWEGGKFILDEEDEMAWQKLIVSALQKYQVAAVYVDQYVKQTKDRSDIFSPHFVRLMQYISGVIDVGAIHLLLTGGATASAIIQSIGKDDLDVQEEVAPGIVTLSGPSRTFFSVKPGSYTWPKQFLKKLSTRQSNSIE